MRIDIRPATTSDIEEISRVVDACWKSNYSEFLPQSAIDKFTGEHRRTAFSEKLSSDAAIYVLLIDGTIVAVCSEISRTDKSSADCFEIAQLYVQPERQHCGLGKKLLMYTLRQARKNGYSCARLETAAQNIAARKFYEKFGFSQLNFMRTIDGIDYVAYKIEF